MREGAWINARTGKSEWIDEHCRWIMRPENAKKIGLPDSIYQEIKDMPWDFNGNGRAQILGKIMKADFIRMRGHGSYWTFEFTMDSEKALWSCYNFLENFGGPFTQCRFNNLRTGETIEMTFQEFKEAMGADPEQVLRTARNMSNAEFPRREHFMATIKKASGYSRLARILKGLVPSIHSFGIFSAENPQGQPLTAEENNKLIARTRKMLNSMSMGYIQHKGKYGGFESPFFVMNISKKDLMNLGTIFDQESVIFGSVDSAKKKVTFEYVEHGVTKDVRTSVCLNADADDYYSEYKGRKFQIPFFDEELDSSVVDSNLPNAVPSMMPEEVNSPENEPHLAVIYARNDDLKKAALGLKVGMGLIGIRGESLQALKRLKKIF